MPTNTTAIPDIHTLPHAPHTRLLRSQGFGARIDLACWPRGAHNPALSHWLASPLPERAARLTCIYSTHPLTRDIVPPPPPPMGAVKLSDAKGALESLLNILDHAPIPDPFKGAVTIVPALALEIITAAEVSMSFCYPSRISHLGCRNPVVRQEQ